jgi:hypothetical protein
MQSRYIAISSVVDLTFTQLSRHVLHSCRQLGSAASLPENWERRRKKSEEICRTWIIPNQSEKNDAHTFQSTKNYLFHCFILQAD